MVDAYIGLGSNLDDPQAHIIRALEELKQLPGSRLAGHSSLYVTSPVGPQSQPDYINAACRLDTELGAHELLEQLQAIEHLHGRLREGEQWGPRTLDLDLLLYGSEIIDMPDLKVPHSELHRRCFVLQPLHEIAGNVVVPGHGSVSDLLAAADCNGVRKLDHD